MELNNFETYFESNEFQTLIKNSLQEDIQDGDHTTLACIPANAVGKAKLLVKENGILCGLPLVNKILNEIDPDLYLELFMQDGQIIKVGDVSFHIHGHSSSILTAERLVLNFLQRLSGISSYTNRLVNMVKHTGIKLLDTRKTTPGLRMLEKYAVHIGGGFNHRMGLYDMIMIKDNHIDFCGGISKAIHQSHEYLKNNHLDLKIEIEARNMQAVKEIMEVGGVHRIMLDNFDLVSLQKALSIINHKFETEASGGITEENLIDFAETGVEYISIGALTHQIKSIDLSLKAF